ncbi:MAG: hypothetical protein Q4F11_03255 [Eubacteriales bacterium]|nr:hypothetical protein [Eubacteriales bacterium]
MERKKVKIIESMMFKIICLFSVGIFLMAGMMVWISLPRSQSMTKELVQNYMLSSAQTNGHILDMAMETSGEAFLKNKSALNQLLSDVKIEGNETSYAYLVDANGTMLYHPTADKI